MNEIQRMASRRGAPDETLNTVVRLVQKRLATDACSLYLLEPDRVHLLLAATVGLREGSVGKIRMPVHEGLVGLIAEQLQPVMVKDVFQHPRFKYFPESGEDSFRTFLGVPVVDKGLLQGVLVVQTIQPRVFSSEEMAVLVEAGKDIGPLIKETRTTEHFLTPIRDRIWAVARNVWWSWDAEAASLFRELDPIRWSELDHNPVALLSEMPIDSLEKRIGRLGLHSRINYTYRRLQEYLEAKKTWGAMHAGALRTRPVAYFSAEFGLHESFPIYSGGLGVLAGDHIKSASDLDVPLVGVGLYYGQGYFHQRLDAGGWQGEEYLKIDVEQVPMELLRREPFEPVRVSIETRTGPISARVWNVRVGRCRLFLLDSDVDGNRPEDRALTSRLYGGDERVRIRQELLLGVGGIRALAAIGIRPGVVHLNEGHSAFVILELILQRMIDEGLDFDEAARRVAGQTVFTTHTPVPAGHDRFHEGLIEEHLGPLRDALGISLDHLMDLGRVKSFNAQEPFCMTVLALKHSRRANAVSSLHGEISRSMWQELWPSRAVDTVPIGHITNGVHVLSWLAPQMQRLYDRQLGSGWSRRSGEPDAWENIEHVDDGELWETHVALKAGLIDFARYRAVSQARRRDESEEHIEHLQRALSLDALTIGFGRRFATYKRATLIFRDLDRIAKLVNDPQQPIQFVFAGKAHPRDNPAKDLLREIARITRDPRFLGKIVFIEDYDINVCRHLVEGVDVWLNTPRRPMEASGTSGQKVVLNGGLNLSILDGWWAEAYDGANGFSIGCGQTHVDALVHDDRDNLALYEALEREVIPMYYQRDRDGLPREWIRRMKRAIRTLGWRFNADRMVMDYVGHCYMPAAGGRSSDMKGV